MPASAIQSQSSKSKKPAANGKGKYISWEEFKRRYLSREDSYKYEWVKGMVEKTKRTMYQDQFTIVFNLRNLFNELLQNGKISGVLELEIDTFFLKDVHRRPDVSYFSLKQSLLMANDQQQVPKFVIEIISRSDQMNQVEDKMENYEAAGVEVVWQIFPKQELVKVYRGKKSIKCKGGDICSAAPILPEFYIAAKDIFKKPELPSEQ
jgi:Uma2 family endonuclease